MSERQQSAIIRAAASDEDDADDADDVVDDHHHHPHAHHQLQHHQLQQQQQQQRLVLHQQQRRRRCCPPPPPLLSQLSTSTSVQVKKQRSYRKRCSSAGCCNSSSPRFVVGSVGERHHHHHHQHQQHQQQRQQQQLHHQQHQQQLHQQHGLFVRDRGGCCSPVSIHSSSSSSNSQGGRPSLPTAATATTVAVDPHSQQCHHLTIRKELASTVKISPSKSEDMTESQPQKKRRISMCVGCGAQIHDQYILHVAPDLEWHAACLKCADCHQFLDETCTCFVRDGKTYCKRDYVRLFGTKCSKCKLGFSKNDTVMRARNKIYHIDCFRCMSCSRQLRPGDEFALKEDSLFCKADHEVLETGSPTGEPNNNNSNSNSGVGGHPGNNNNQNGHLSQNGLQLAASAEPALVSSTGRQRDSVRPQVHKNNGGGGGSDSTQQQKTTRVRTVLNEKQLHTLRTCYAANPRPDALMKEQLVEMTGLSPRVIRVWFQNKRCKDKKRSILMKQMQQQEKDGRRLPALAGMHGVPMIASSPVRHESPLHVINAAAVEVHSYQPPWKALSEFAMQAAAAAGGELDRLDPSAAPFQQLVSQMHGYADTGDGLTSLSGHPQLTYLGNDDSLQQPPSNMSSQIPGTPSELSSPGSD